MIDLGVDVPAARFAEEVQKSKPDFLGLSALLTSTMDVQKEVINELARSRSRTNVKVVVGGAPLTKSWAKAIGADAYGADAVETIREAKALVGIQSAPTPSARSIWNALPATRTNTCPE